MCKWELWFSACLYVAGSNNQLHDKHLQINFSQFLLICNSITRVQDWLEVCEWTIHFSRDSNKTWMLALPFFSSFGRLDEVIAMETIYHTLIVTKTIRPNFTSQTFQLVWFIDIINRLQIFYIRAVTWNRDINNLQPLLRQIIQSLSTKIILHGITWNNIQWRWTK